MPSPTCRLLISPRDPLGPLVPEIEPARLRSVPGAIRVAAGERGGRADVTRTESDLPVIVAGPILRRAEATGIKVWIATSAPVTVRATLYSKNTHHEWLPAGTSGPGSVLRLGRNLYIHLVSLAAPIEENHIYGYDLTFEAPEGMEFTHGDGLIPRADLVYRGYPYPTFLRGLPRSARRLSLLHASCRKLHGPGIDAVPSMDRYLESKATSLAERPAALLLTGDQIYGDDVHPSVLGAVMRASEVLLGFPEHLPSPHGLGRTTADVLPNRRWEIIRNGGFTVDAEAGQCHLLGLGEYAAMYALSWSPAMWQWPRVESVHGSTFREQRASLTAVRRVMANVPVYMILDDHEITDDWPLTESMRTSVRDERLGAWVVANGMAACWAFQLWGNGTPPGTPVEGPIRTYVEACLSAGADRARLEQARDRFVRAVFPAAGFMCVVPTYPTIVMMDTRTERDLTGTCPGLLDTGALRRLASLLQGLGSEAPAPLLLVSPAPILGFGLHEAAATLHPVAFMDPEAWSLNEACFERFLRVLAATERSAVVAFSGDVHYSFFATARLAPHGRRIHGTPLVQLTCSALRNESEGLLRTFVGHTSAPRWQILSGVSFHDVGIGTQLLPDNSFGAVTIEWTESGTVTVEQALIGAFGRVSASVRLTDS